MKKVITAFIIVAGILLVPFKEVQGAGLFGVELALGMFTSVETELVDEPLIIEDTKSKKAKESTKVVNTRSYYVSKTSLNKRSTPNIIHKQIGWLKKGQPVVVVRYVDNGWVQLKGGSFVNAKYLKKKEWTGAQYRIALKKYKEREQRLQDLNKTRGIKITKAERELLARLVHAEAGAEPYEGQVAVASVVLNRLKDKRFPNTIRKIIYQPKQFVPAASGSIKRKAGRQQYRAVDQALREDNISGALYFYNPHTSTSRWLDKLETVKTIGKHVFKVN